MLEGTPSMDGSCGAAVAAVVAGVVVVLVVVVASCCAKRVGTAWASLASFANSAFRESLEMLGGSGSFWVERVLTSSSVIIAITSSILLGALT